MWPKPGSEKPAKKLSYIRKVKMPDGGTVIVGAGMYVTERLSLTTTASDKWETFARSEFIRRHAAGQCAWIVIVSMNCLFEPEQSAIVQRLSAGLADVESKCDAINSECRPSSRYIAGINNQITTTNWQAWEQQQASYVRIGRCFSESIRGIDTYQIR